MSNLVSYISQQLDALETLNTWASKQTIDAPASTATINDPCLTEAEEWDLRALEAYGQKCLDEINKKFDADMAAGKI